MVRVGLDYAFTPLFNTPFARYQTNHQSSRLNTVNLRQNAYLYHSSHCHRSHPGSTLFTDGIHPFFVPAINTLYMCVSVSPSSQTFSTPTASRFFTALVLPSPTEPTRFNHRHHHFRSEQTSAQCLLSHTHAVSQSW